MLTVPVWLNAYWAVVVVALAAWVFALTSHLRQRHDNHPKM